MTDSVTDSVTDSPFIGRSAATSGPAIKHKDARLVLHGPIQEHTRQLQVIIVRQYLRAKQRVSPFCHYSR